MKSTENSDVQAVVIVIGKGLDVSEICNIVKGVYPGQQVAEVKPLETERSPKPTKSLKKGYSRVTISDKQRIIKFLKKGWTKQRIQEKLSGKYTIQQISAISAWITMGKY